MNKNRPVKNKNKKNSIKNEKNAVASQGVDGCAARLVSVRERLKLNQSNFALQLGFRNSYISELEAGEKKFSKNVLLRLADVFNISPNWILLGIGPMFLGEQSAGMGGYPLEIRGDPELENLVWHYLNSPMVKYSLLGYFFKLLRRNKTIIDDDILIHRSQNNGGKKSSSRDTILNKEGLSNGTLYRDEVQGTERKGEDGTG